MVSVLVCAMPLDGHVAPMLEVARVLVADGHRVGFLTGRDYTAAVTATGAAHVPLPVESDVTQQMLDEGRARSGRRLKGIGFAIDNTRRCFVRTLPGWCAAILAEQAAGRADVVLAETTVFAMGAIAARPAGERPGLIACGVTPVVLLSRDTAPVMLGLPPRPGIIGRLRNRMLNLLVTRLVFGGLQREADDLARRACGAGLPCFLTDWPRVAEAYLQFSVPSFEYPRSDAPDQLRFVGPLAAAVGAVSRPDWWPELDGGRPVVLVSQGTLANRDLDELVRPTIRALAERDLLVVVATGGRPIADLGPLPANVRAATLLDYGELMPRVDVFVTNGGYGSLNAALRHGVPIVVAGDTEDKVETSARVAWSGAGVSLRTGTPTAHRIREAVEAVLADRRYAQAAGRIGAEIAAAPGAAAVLEAVQAVAG